VSFLAQCSLFKQLPPGELAALEAVALPRRFATGEVLFREGDPGDGLYVIQSGELQVTCLVGPNDPRVLTTFGPGDVVGEMTVVDAQPRSATVIVTQAAELIYLPCEDVRRVLQRSPETALNLAREVVQRIRDFTQFYTREVVQAERLALVGRFARSIVHDFKNPLNIIGISADMMAMDTSTTQSRVVACSRVRRQVDRLSNMISELLEFTRGGSSSVALTRVSFSDFLRPLLAEIAQEIEPRSIRLEMDTDLPEVGVMMDPRRLVHLFHNLINNACDAMPTGGTIHLRFEVLGDEVVVELRDTGKGIAPEIQGRLFEAFATHGKPNGTGLGLSICKRIVEDHGGRIEARNAPEGGAIFAFVLQLAATSTSNKTGGS